jgi:hypothetical protein
MLNTTSYVRRTMSYGVRTTSYVDIVRRRTMSYLARIQMTYCLVQMPRWNSRTVMYHHILVCTSHGTSGVPVRTNLPDPVQGYRIPDGSEFLRFYYIPAPNCSDSSNFQVVLKDTLVTCPEGSLAPIFHQDSSRCPRKD